jgi:hypothetical protein
VVRMNPHTQSPNRASIRRSQASSKRALQVALNALQKLPGAGHVRYGSSGCGRQANGSAGLSAIPD